MFSNEYKENNNSKNHKKHTEISVIIPVYQVEKYLSECIESVLSQKYDPVEIILVDDGSTDRSSLICDDYSDKYKNIKVIHKKNEGQSAARNTGMKIASGDYLMFLDSDDMLAAPDILHHMAKCISESNADILTGNFCMYKDGQPGDIHRHHLKNGAYVQTSEFRFNAFYRIGHLSYPWGKLYRKQFLEKNQILFKKFPVAEDKLFNLECYLKGAQYEFTDRPIIFYRQRPESQTASYHSDFIHFWYCIAEQYSSLRLQCHAPEEYEDIIAFHYFFGAFLLVKQELIYHKRNHAVRKAAEELKKYVSIPSVSQVFFDLSKGKHLQTIPVKTWYFLIRISSLLLKYKHYFLFTVSVFVFDFLKMNIHTKRGCI